MTDREQHMEALARANEIRRQQAELKRLCKTGFVDVMYLIAHPVFARQRLADVLDLKPRYGCAIVENAMARLNLPTCVLCGDMTPRQRALLARWLRQPNQRPAIEVQEQSRWSA